MQVLKDSLIQGEKDEIAMIEQRMASRRNQFQGELHEIQSKKDMVESHITQVVDKGAEDKRHMVSGKYGYTIYIYTYIPLIHKFTKTYYFEFIFKEVFFGCLINPIY